MLPLKVIGKPVRAVNRSSKPQLFRIAFSTLLPCSISGVS